MKKTQKKKLKKEDNAFLSTKGKTSTPIFSRIQRPTVERPLVITGGLKNISKIINVSNTHTNC